MLSNVIFYSTLTHSITLTVTVTLTPRECQYSSRTHCTVPIPPSSSPSLLAGWIDWNLLVDFEGGPNHLGNMCDAPIVTLEDFSDVHVQPKYYYFGHISKFVPPGSVRVESSTVGE